MATSKNKTIGQELKYARENQKLPLRTVEDITGISNAYLSQLENDKIKKPSANVLHKLADVYKLDFSYLLEKSGILDNQTQTNKSFGQYVFSKDNLTSEEEDQLLQYLQFLRTRKK